MLRRLLLTKYLLFFFPLIFIAGAQNNLWLRPASGVSIT